MKDKTLLDAVAAINRVRLEAENEFVRRWCREVSGFLRWLIERNEEPYDA